MGTASGRWWSVVGAVSSHLPSRNHSQTHTSTHTHTTHTQHTHTHTHNARARAQEKTYTHLRARAISLSLSYTHTHTHAHTHTHTQELTKHLGSSHASLSRRQILTVRVHAQSCSPLLRGALGSASVPSTRRLLGSHVSVGPTMAEHSPEHSARASRRELLVVAVCLNPNT
jgi:hypothetical protein